MRALLLLLLATTGTHALFEKEKKDEEPDRFAQFKTRPALAYTSSALIVGTATGMQMVTRPWVEKVLGEASASGVGAFAASCAEWLHAQRVANPLGMVLAHGTITKGCADVLAQVIPAQAAAEVWVDPMRLVRSTLASVLSTSLPFYYWTKLMASMSKAGWFSGGFAGNALKTIVTQTLFRPINVGLFLGLQSIFRGDSARKLRTVMSTKFAKSLVGGIAFYSVANLAMYSVPIPFLHPIMGSIAGLVFNVWLAVQAYQK